ncbi:hypothetical protein Y032_0001g63 [Ancylostoma ceylanicum]|uniref:Uncharacterized protein n=1 Tax=Ancylostoma ceylanicum TaxID=53326 RepID=A0A016W5T6_9BILA|nr:hypothetical protein Y032_0001g63 [Ancylostoma ceylanicum]
MTRKKDKEEEDERTENDGSVEEGKASQMDSTDTDEPKQIHRFSVSYLCVAEGSHANETRERVHVLMVSSNRVCIMSSLAVLGEFVALVDDETSSS